jgi:hypothetical protein
VGLDTRRCVPFLVFRGLDCSVFGNPGYAGG